MTEIQHDHLSERMAAVVSGREQWSASEARHLASCGECDDEFALLLAARQAGDGAPEIDVARLSSTLLPRVAAARRDDRRRSTWRWGSGLLAAAAAVVLVAMPLLRGTAPGALPAALPAMVPGSLVLSELDALDLAGLQGVLEAVDAGLPAGELVEDGAPTGLDASDIDAVFEGLEG